MTTRISKHTVLKVLLFSLLATATSPPQEKRPFRLDDAFSSESISDISFSPDGQVLAYVRPRPLNTLPTEAQSSLGLFPREDVWIQVSGQSPRKITDGERDTSKW